MAGHGKTLDLFTEPAPEERERDDSVLRRPRTLLRTHGGPRDPGPRSQPAGSSPRHLWIALYFPCFALEAINSVRASVAEQISEPLVIVETLDRQQRVIACNRASADRGITLGLSLNAARALADKLQIRERDVGKEHACLERLAAWAGRFTSRVSLEPPDGLLLEVRGSLELFGGIEALCALLLQEIHGRGMTAVLAMAPMPRAASWLAQAGDTVRITHPADLRNALAVLPLAATRWAEPAIQLLGAVGLHSVGDCLRLPREGLARRLGPGYLLELDQAMGKVPDVRRDFLGRVRFRIAAEFEEEIENCTLLLPQLESMCGRLAAFLHSRQRGVQALELSLYHRDREPTRATLRFVTPVNQREQIVAVIREHLLRTFLPAPVRSARLRSGQLLDIQAGTERISFAGGAGEFREREPEEGLRLLERLRARLGESALYRLEVIADHRPEKASGRSSDFSMQTDSRSAGIATGSRPLWLLDSPRSLEEQKGWPCHEGALTIEYGPERIESGWWDGKDMTRDYYRARTVAGVRLWIYRDRQAPHGWFLHGFFG